MIALFLLAVLELRDGWRYAMTTPGAQRPAAESAWKTDIDPAPEKDRWYRTAIPSTAPADARLVFRSYIPTFTIFAGDQTIYSFDEPAAGGRLRLHVVPLPPRSAGRTLYVHIRSGSRWPMFTGPPMLASPREVPRALTAISTAPLHEDLRTIVFGIVLVVVGFGSVIIASIRSRDAGGALFWFGVFGSMYGLRLIIQSYLPLLLGASMDHADYAQAWLTYTITIPGWTLARKLLGDGWKRTLRWQVALFAVFAPIAIASDLIQQRPGSLERVNNGLVILGGLLILVTLIRVPQGRSRDLRIVLFGAMVFLGFALMNNLRNLGVPIGWVDETWGFLVFVVALNYAAARMFVRGEQERAALQGELATAREIQLSILPTSMPRVQGLRFSARYDPASSVAGDFYDFVARGEQQVGVIVADVAGHGVPAALIASMVKVAVASNARFADEPGAMLSELHSVLLRDVRRNFVTATYLWLDMERSSVTVSNAGHPPPLLIRGSESHELGPHGVLLGRFAKAAWDASTITVQSGDRIAAWTDGIVEARSARGEEFGHERLEEALRSGRTADEIVEAVHAWRVADDADDLTLVIVDVA